MNNPILKEDIQELCSDTSIPFERLCGKTVFVTGGTGLLGAFFTKTLLHYMQENHLDADVYLLVRDIEKADRIFSSFKDNIHLHYLLGDMSLIPSLDIKPDYIFHGASPTDSAAFINTPVEVICTIFDGTASILELARKSETLATVYLSSMEVYGNLTEEPEIHEDTPGLVDSSQLRSSYPEAKRLSENLCLAYAREYAVPVTVARLSQCFGSGVDLLSENRVFAQFAKSAISGKDIILHTKGESAHCYTYTADAVRGLLLLLLKGEAGQVYNVANPDTFCSIYEMAELVASQYGVKVQVQENKAEQQKYPQTHKLRLNIDKLKTLGFVPRYDLLTMYQRMIAYSSQA